jgi:hypothetical protein
MLHEHKTTHRVRWIWGVSLCAAAAAAIAYLVCVTFAETASDYLQAVPVGIAGFICTAVTAAVVCRRMPRYARAWGPAAATTAVAGFACYTVGDGMLAAENGWSAVFATGVSFFALGHILLATSAVCAAFERGGRRRIKTDRLGAICAVAAVTGLAAIVVAVLVASPSVCAGGSTAIGTLSFFYLALFAVQVAVFGVYGESHRTAAVTVAGALTFLASDVILITTGEMCADTPGTIPTYMVMLTYWAGVAMIAVGPYTMFARWAGWAREA